MPITQRVISSHAIPHDAYKDAQDVVLDSVAAYKMVNILNQIGQLSEFAADIFEGLVKESAGTAHRVQNLAGRINNFESFIPKIEAVFEHKSPSHFYQSARGKEWKRNEVISSSLFDPRTQPAPIQKSRAAAAPPPNVSLLDVLSKKVCLRDYTNPAFFFEQWVAAEEEKQKRLMEENKARRAKKNNKTKKQPKKPRQVEKVQVKTFNPQGAEFGSPQQQQQQQLQQLQQQTPLTQQQPQTPHSQQETQEESEEPPLKPQQQEVTDTTAFEEDEAKDDEKDDDDPNSGQTSSPPLPAYPQSGMSPPSYNQSMDHGQYQQPYQQPYHPQTPKMSAPLAPEAPPAPEDIPTHYVPSPQHPKQSIQAPSAPEAPAPTWDVEANTGQFLEILNSVKLKKATPVQKKTDARGGLLEEIRRGAKLKEVAKEVSEEKKQKESQKAVGGLSSIMDILSRRQAIKGSESEEEEGDDWGD